MSALVEKMIDKYMEQNLYAVVYCLQNMYASPSLILLYSIIDIMASLNRAQQHEYVDKDDFISWVDQYLLPGSALDCSAIDLYSARCAILHSMSAESSMSVRGKARKIYHAIGDGDARKLQLSIESRQDNAVAIHIDNLYKALKEGIVKYAQSISNNSKMEGVVLSRMEKLLTIMSIDSMDKYLKNKNPNKLPQFPENPISL